MRKLFVKVKARILLARIRVNNAKADKIIAKSLKQIDELHEQYHGDGFVDQMAMDAELKLLDNIQKALDVHLETAKRCPEGLVEPTIVDHMLALFA